MELTASLATETVDTQRSKVNKILSNLIGYYIFMEGIFFYSGFVMVLSFQRRNLLPGIHLNFGIDLINGIKAENPDVAP